MTTAHFESHQWQRKQRKRSRYPHHQRAPRIAAQDPRLAWLKRKTNHSHAPVAAHTETYSSSNTANTKPQSDAAEDGASVPSPTTSSSSPECSEGGSWRRPSLDLEPCAKEVLAARPSVALSRDALTPSTLSGSDFEELMLDVFGEADEWRRMGAQHSDNSCDNSCGESGPFVDSAVHSVPSPSPSSSLDSASSPSSAGGDDDGYDNDGDDNDGDEEENKSCATREPAEPAHRGHCTSPPPKRAHLIRSGAEEEAKHTAQTTPMQERGEQQQEAALVATQRQAAPVSTPDEQRTVAQQVQGQRLDELVRRAGGGLCLGCNNIKPLEIRRCLSKKGKFAICNACRKTHLYRIMRDIRSWNSTHRPQLQAMGVAERDTDSLMCAALSHGWHDSRMSRILHLALSSDPRHVAYTLLADEHIQDLRKRIQELLHTISEGPDTGGNATAPVVLFSHITVLGQPYCVGLQAVVSRAQDHVARKVQACVVRELNRVLDLKTAPPPTSTTTSERDTALQFALQAHTPSVPCLKERDVTKGKRWRKTPAEPHCKRAKQPHLASIKKFEEGVDAIAWDATRGNPWRSGCYLLQTFEVCNACRKTHLSKVIREMNDVSDNWVTRLDTDSTLAQAMLHKFPACHPKAATQTPHSSSSKESRGAQNDDDDKEQQHNGDKETDKAPSTRQLRRTTRTGTRRQLTEGSWTALAETLARQELMQRWKDARKSRVLQLYCRSDMVHVRFTLLMEKHLEAVRAALLKECAKTRHQQETRGHASSATGDTLSATDTASATSARATKPLSDSSTTTIFTIKVRGQVFSVGPLVLPRAATAAFLSRAKLIVRDLLNGANKALIATAATTSLRTTHAGDDDDDDEDDGGGRLPSLPQEPPQEPPQDRSFHSMCLLHGYANEHLDVADIAFLTAG
ncbi:hypothetical protein PTSG_12345 [Salpingoeca rosetta]|uniref:Uncharacterized protein n=1 Tax=Salpingoeca rosetta (strain ATCC 50818 / BSB-021) TaxID=946362 RepID=F2UBT2_SALR5|nr:uncharacterized protein PTSG_12345 [Salpingoeca rosetta]EGD73948.1 hypothetical protein PTSG_12345 [Salpingoeca rosetta]|eukprot:XP_004993511.1 hypothetical protein PTSG_12345 [Salpingoeca rosetta]